jgi:serine/threonine-protein kinase TTK/MPS1
MKAIPDPNHVIDFPEYSVPLKLGSGDKPDVRIEGLATQLSPDLINSMKMCLVRDPKKRGTIPELLAQNWVEGSECTGTPFASRKIPHYAIAADMPAAIPLPTTPPPKTPILKEDESIMTQVHNCFDRIGI